jgi:redox-sensitive bicupin YhaK (pirin superfamily)
MGREHDRGSHCCSFNNERRIVGYSRFVMNSEAEIRQAIDDFNGGRFGRIGQ